MAVSFWTVLSLALYAVGVWLATLVALSDGPWFLRWPLAVLLFTVFNALSYIVLDR